jgi:SAM-dependent methyltransferase
MPLDEVLDRYYQGYYAKAGTGTPNVTIDGADRFAAAIAALLPDLAGGTEPLAILDFGGGDGSLSVAIAQALCRRGVAEVVDRAPTKVLEDESVVLRYHDELGGLEGAFDLVLASAVLEHVPACGTLFQELWSRVRPGGYFYARTPYVEPFMRLVPRIDMSYPAHVHDLGPGFWNRVAETFELDAEVLISRPSTVETELGEHFLRTVAAHALKLPARVETRLRGRPRALLWPFVGGWEVLLRRGGGAGPGAAS